MLQWQTAGKGMACPLQTSLVVSIISLGERQNLSAGIVPPNCTTELVQFEEVAVADIFWCDFAITIKAQMKDYGSGHTLKLTL
jgi:hypothetical protein